MDLSSIFKLREPYVSALAFHVSTHDAPSGPPVNPINDPWATEKKAFAMYVNDRRGDARFIEYDRDGSLSMSAFVAHICAEWDPEDENVRRLNRRFLDIDMPFDEETRAKFPHVLAHVNRLEELIAPEVRATMGVISDALLDHKTSGRAALMAMIGFARDLYTQKSFTSAEAVAQAQDLMEKNHIAVHDLEKLSEYVLSSTDTSDLARSVLFNTYRKEGAAMASALRDYKEKLTAQSAEPNRYLLRVIDEMALGLDYGFKTPAAVLNLLRPYHHSSPKEARFFSERPGLTYDEVCAHLKGGPESSVKLLS